MASRARKAARINALFVVAMEGVSISFSIVANGGRSDFISWDFLNTDGVERLTVRKTAWE